MALLRLFLKPGIDKQNTEYGAEGGWVDSDYVRFRYGLPEKLGGWVDFDSTQVNFVGLTSEVFAWNALDGAPYVVLGTNRKVYVFYGGQWADITPIRATGTATFTTTSGSTLVTVNDPAHGAVQGDFVTFSSVTGNPGGISNASLQNEFQVQQVLLDATYTIVSPMAATSNAIEAGTADAAYQINVGADKSFTDFGWGTGTWGFITWGTPRPPSAALSLVMRVWQFDNYGENLILQQVDGKVYEWRPSDGIDTRATVLAGAPTKSKYALVSTPDRHLVCFGTESVLGDPTTQDPMYVRFSDQENIGNFVATATNTAGGQRLTDGNEIVSALRSRGQILIWTDTSLHGQQFIGPPYTFGFQQLGANCGIIAPHASADVNGVAYWMSKDAFFVFDGTVKKIPCTVQDYVFSDLNTAQAYAVNVGINTQFNEVTWYYPSLSSNYVDRFVTYNYMENVWSIGTMARTAWQDIGSFDKPMGAEYLPLDNSATLTPIYGLTAGRTHLYSQESGVDANGEPIEAYIYSGYFDIGDGDQVLFMKRFIPDFKRQTGDLTVRLLLRLYPQTSATPSSLDPYIITPTTDKVDTRARGRQIQLRIESDQLNGWWRFGTMRVDIQPDGTR
ncbi:hypothetical protein UFOVP734_38 [uncultured Caudovirales phage]|uniref:Uncharacterized protein n=3 Tax=uncultured Caudovirales phage TaxID=2100421 RepID=A0A6J7X270_9CAUD|nr:hypothetical protein UFOVP734_38 [uncultured Caudovirales phage]